MSPRKVVVYAGPTISAGEVHDLVPQAEVRPPVARGDLFAEDFAPGDTAVIIDGYYRERLSVGHKEILRLLQEGVEVIGAASMGALRAAELHPYGMRGVGEVFGMYATGVVDGDDEVAVLHGPAAMGYRASTVAMVNIRYGCREGARAELLPADAAERIVAEAKARPFTHRTWQEMEQALGPDAGGPLRTLQRKIGTGEWDVKRLDAMTALRAAAGQPAAAPAAPPAGAGLTGLTRDEALRRRSRREYAPGRWMSDLDALNAGRLFDPGYPALHEEVLTGLLRGFAAAQGLDLSAYAHATLGVGDGEVLPPGLAAWLTAEESATLPTADRLRLVMVRVWPVWQSADWRPALLEHVEGTGRWAQWCELVAGADEAAERSRGRLVLPPPELCGRIFMRHWRRPGAQAEVELARRGFFAAEELGRVARRFFALDVQRGRGSG
ncbi:hypothetical protein Sme01_12000 [Sphaerisporangium melleum]|uniref:TfuA-like core domain-containing protein n=1 Tax=Sphaerisporangium melleum TaxID=321316 RepID=A0A917RHB1_9ACTN|nr:TfuA-like protein [Sphaerisporangium melleum]GGL07145.1 hypothetical protein GCM10007964_56780 [Sphaerisporangium melleum]GII68724.1 hypothetical protein Sme01_12000 [Sphaerisporangium melleum]